MKCASRIEIEAADANVHCGITRNQKSESERKEVEGIPQHGCVLEAMEWHIAAKCYRIMCNRVQSAAMLDCSGKRCLAL